MRLLSILIACSCLAASVAYAGSGGEAGRYMTTTEFLDSAFPDGAPDPGTLWVTGDVRQSIEEILGHPFGTLRVRYWHDGTASAWILDEIGKELPITIGVSIADGVIHEVHILEFRESRGWEVKYPFFTDQFRNATLRDDGRLNTHIDGITGATLSVRAVKRIARVALVLHGNVSQQQ